MDRGRISFGSLVLLFGMLTLGVTGVHAQSGSLEPPGSAVNGSGDPMATTQTQPSWDQVLPVKERFKLVMGGTAVLDKETGLVWEQSPQGETPPDTSDQWVTARRQCNELAVGGRKSWRLPSVHELASLLDPTNTIGNLDLPLGHPFNNVTAGFYWTATAQAGSINKRWVVRFSNSSILAFGDVNPIRIRTWCVRGGSPGPDAY